MPDVRPHDLVLFGATGFTGGLIARYLARRLAGTPLRWALAGRGREKLGKLRRELEREDPVMAELGIIEASSDDHESLCAMAAATRAIITTVGPYQRHGEPLVAACVEQGTDYFDLTGETHWWKGIVERYHERARARDVIMVPCCGFEAVPHDLGALFTASQLPGGQPITIDAYVRARGSISGGTLASALAELSSGVVRKKAGRRGGGTRVKPRFHYADALGLWAVPAPTIEPLIVRRSAELLPELADDLQFREYFAFRSPGKAAMMTAGAATVAALASFRPTRQLLQKIRPQGSGPDPEARSRGWFRIDFVGRAGGREVRTHVSGGDPGYDETAKMISEAAITTLEDRDRLALRGVLTPASGLGWPLIERLRAAEIEFAVD
jgi:short subunit dehydrogenase-like uncharacterized protein